MNETVGPETSTRDALVRDAAARFQEHFGRPPAWVSTAPGRVNLIGEHTDYNAGFVLPLAIDRWCVCVAAPASGRASRFVAADIDESFDASLAGLVARGHTAAGELPEWGRYLTGAMVERARGVRSAGADTTPPELDVLAMSTVPVGGGLSSSAAIETAGAVMVETALGLSPADEPDAGAFLLTRALDCQRAEHRWAGVPCGLMDQLASTFGRDGQALCIDCRDNSVEHVPVPSPDRAIVLVVNSGVRHALASGEYAARRAACEAASDALGVASLREIESVDAVNWSRLDDEQTRCIRHVVSENRRVLRAAEALRADRLEALGTLMIESHASLRDDYRVSCAELDSIVEIATATPGVFGARMTGGGFGGCAVVLATPDAAASLRATLPEAYSAAHGRACDLWPVVASAGAAGSGL
ncbi:MAG: galactokinase [Phycisphaerales bacterium JB054]